MTALTEVEPLIVDSSIKYICNTLMVPSLDSISTLNYYHIGQSGKASIKFQDDLPSSQDELTFVLDTDYFPDDNVLLGKIPSILFRLEPIWKLNKIILINSIYSFLQTA